MHPFLRALLHQDLSPTVDPDSDLSTDWARGLEPGTTRTLAFIRLFIHAAARGDQAAAASIMDDGVAVLADQEYTIFSIATAAVASYQDLAPAYAATQAASGTGGTRS
jgi:hypothetical protein